MRNKYRNDPQYRDAFNERRRKRLDDPEQRATVQRLARRRYRERYANDPEYRARCKARNEGRMWRLRKHLPDLIEAQDGLCGICGAPLPEEIDSAIHVDHIKPRSKGGSNDYDNLQAVHDSCNRRKSDQWTAD